MTNSNQYNVAVVGVTGAVGQRIIEMLEQVDFPVNQLIPLASKRSVGKTVDFKGESIEIKEALPEQFDDVDIAFFSAGGSVSKQLAPEAVERERLSLTIRVPIGMDEQVPLVVPEVNEQDILNHQGIIANPNCSTIQMVAALEPIRQKYGMKRIIVSTYQSVSGSGNQAMDELTHQSQAMLNNEEVFAEVLPVKSEKKHFPIAFNALPQIDTFDENHYTLEEMKMVNETKKIMHDDELQVSATCVRLPFYYSHAESVYG